MVWTGSQLLGALRRNRGFTLIELLIAVLIIGILAAIALPAFNKQRERAKDSAAQQGLEAGLRAAKAIYADGESFPASGLGAIFTRAERSQSFADASAFPAGAGTINVERRSAQDVVLRATSASGNQHMLRLQEPDSRVTRYAPLTTSSSSSLTTLTNLVNNPSLESNLTCWDYTPAGAGVAAPSLFARETVWADSGSYSLHSQAAPAGGQYTSVRWGVGCSAPVVAGEQYTASFATRITSQTGSLRAIINWMDSGSVQFASSSGPISGVSSGEARLSVTGTAPDNAARAYILLLAQGPGTLDIHVDSAMLVAANRPVTYFDGANGLGAWTGAAHNSTSTGPAGSSSW